MLEFTQGNSFEQVIPIFGLDKEGNKTLMPTEGMEVSFSIYKDGSLKYTQTLEPEQEGFRIEISEEKIDMFGVGSFIAKIKIKKGKETKTKSIPLTISE